MLLTKPFVTDEPVIKSGKIGNMKLDDAKSSDNACQTGKLTVLKMVRSQVAVTIHVL